MENQLKFFSFIKEHTSINPSTFLDVGSFDANNCVLALNHFNSLKPENIYAIEPNPISYQKILKNTNLPHFNLFNLAFSNSNENLIIKNYHSDNNNITACSSILNRSDHWAINLNANPISYHNVNAVKPYEFINSFIGKTVDVAIIDVEGYSFEVIKGFFNNNSNNLPLSFMIEVETNDSVFGVNTYNLITQFMETNVPNYSKSLELNAFINQIDIIYTLNSNLLS